MRLFNVLAIGATLAAGAALGPRGAAADRVCHQECAGAVCEERCDDRDVRERHDDRDDSRHEERQDRDRPGIELRVPRVGGVEIGR